MLKLLMVGFDRQELVPHENFIFAIHSPGVPEDMSNTEYYLKCLNMVSEADIVLVKNVERCLFEDEVVILYSAYTTSTPIFGVGYPYSDSPLLSVVMSNVFKHMEATIDHLNAYYTRRII